MFLSVFSYMNFIRKIAITGVIGAGKSATGEILSQKGLNFVSADELAQQAISPQNKGYALLLKILGPRYLQNTSKEFDKKKIALQLFKSPALLKRVESVIHPIVWDLMKKKEKELCRAGKKSVFYEIPLLFEKKWEDRFDIRVVIATDLEKRKKRLKKNQTMGGEDIKNRISFQISQEEKMKRADYVIWNNSSLKELEKQVSQFLEKFDL